MKGNNGMVMMTNCVNFAKTSEVWNRTGSAHITSSYYSPNLGRSIALGLVKSGTKKKGAKLIVPTVGKSIKVEITSPVFIDPENERLFAWL